MKAEEEREKEEARAEASQILRQVLPSDLRREEGDPPEAPLDFGEKYTPPAHCEKPLSKRNAHPADEDLAFYELPHIYTFSGVPATTSVTSLAHGYEVPFDPKAAILTMKMGRGQAWPRLEYVHNALRVSSGDTSSPLDGRGVLVRHSGKTNAVCLPQSLKAGSTLQHALEFLESQVCFNISEALAADAAGADVAASACGEKRPSSHVDRPELYTFERCMSDSEIEKMWEENGRDACNRGTEAHYQAELFMNGLPCRVWEGEMQVFFSFLRTYAIPKKLVAYRTEMEVYCEEADVAGSIDLIMYDPVGNVYHIIDHKRSDKLRSGFKGYRKMNPPLDHLQDCKGASYALQLSFYEYILTRTYGLTIGDRILLSLHPEKPCAVKVPYMGAEVEFIMQNRVRLVEARKEVAASDPSFVCELTGSPAVDAVLLADGRRAMEKKATVLGLPFTVDSSTRSKFEAAVQKRVTSVQLDQTNCTAWWRTVNNRVEFLQV